MEAKRLYGLIGFPLGNSFSATYFSEKFKANAIDAVYTNFPLQHIDELPALLKKLPHLCGLNVTIPHKKSVIPFLTTLHPNAAAVGAVNTISIQGNELIGYNTDVIGFEQSILPILKPWHQKALVLGSGGAAQAVCFVLNKLGITYHMVSSSNSNLLQYADLSKALIRSHQVIINCTPLGMFPNQKKAPEIPYEFLTDLHLAFDLIYLPEETQFLSLCKKQGATIKNGLEMLHRQAEEAYKIWIS